MFTFLGWNNCFLKSRPCFFLTICFHANTLTWALAWAFVFHLFAFFLNLFVSFLCVCFKLLVFCFFWGGCSSRVQIPTTDLVVQTQLCCRKFFNPSWRQNQNRKKSLLQVWMSWRRWWRSLTNIEVWRISLLTLATDPNASWMSSTQRPLYWIQLTRTKLAPFLPLELP